MNAPTTPPPNNNEWSPRHNREGCDNKNGSTSRTRDGYDPSPSIFIINFMTLEYALAHTPIHLSYLILSSLILSYLITSYRITHSHSFVASQSPPFDSIHLRASVRCCLNDRLGISNMTGLKTCMHLKS